MRRDFTYVDDVVESVVRLIDQSGRARPVMVGRSSRSGDAAPRPGASTTSATTSRSKFCTWFELLEQALGTKAKRELLPMQPGDVPETYADVDDLMRDVGFRPSTPIETGIRNFVDWYRAYTGA